MKKDISRFWKAILILLSCLIIFDFIIGTALDKIFVSLPLSPTEVSKLSYRFKSTNDDVVFVGSSRCRHHFVTNQISDSLDNIGLKDLKVYNYGIDGMYANSSLMMIESMLQRCTPKMVILETECLEFGYDEVFMKGITSASPLYWKDKVVKHYIDGLGISEKIPMLVNMWRYKGAMPIRLLRSITVKGDSLNGYLPLYNKMTVYTVNGKSAEKIKLRPYTISNFNRVAQLCRKNNVKLILVSTPKFKSSSDNCALNELCKKCNVIYIDDYCVFDNDPKWFSDKGHLNDEGAHIFTSLFFSQLKPFL